MTRAVGLHVIVTSTPLTKCQTTVSEINGLCMAFKLEEIPVVWEQIQLTEFTPTLTHIPL